MIKNQRFFVQQVIEPAVYDGATATSRVIDLVDVDEVLVTVRLGTTDAALTTLKVQASDVATDVTTLATPSDVTGLVYGVSTDPYTGTTSVTPAATDDFKTYGFSFRAKEIGKRYAQVVCTAANTTVGAAVSAQAIVWKGEGPKNDATSAGLAAILIA